jgi:hypothetical protein
MRKVPYRVLAVAASGVLLGGCPDGLPIPTPLNETLKAAGYIVLPLPDNKSRPGAVVEVTNNGGQPVVRWLADIRSCGLTDSDMGFQKGIAPQFDLSNAFSVDVGAVFSIAKINASLSPDLQAAKSASLT